MIDPAGMVYHPFFGISPISSSGAAGGYVIYPTICEVIHILCVILLTYFL
jgi:hypothetical protein